MDEDEFADIADEILLYGSTVLACVLAFLGCRIGFLFAADGRFQRYLRRGGAFYRGGF